MKYRSIWNLNQILKSRVNIAVYHCFTKICRYKNMQHVDKRWKIVLCAKTNKYSSDQSTKWKNYILEISYKTSEKYVKLLENKWPEKILNLNKNTKEKIRKIIETLLKYYQKILESRQICNSLQFVEKSRFKMLKKS